MEDAHVYMTDKGTIAGIFDGHGGAEISAFVAKRVEELFFPLLKKNQDDVHQAFTEMFNQIEDEIKAHREWNAQGSTAVLSFMDPKTKKIYTATIGDSEATIYRKTPQSNIRKAIPISCLRNWASEKDLKRLLNAQPGRQLLKNPKDIRYPSSWYGVNVSRSLGDEGVKKYIQPSALIHKPKITMQDVNPGDRIVIACDGLKDFTTEQEVIDVLKQHPKNNKLAAQALVGFALHQKFSSDNVSVMVISVK